jgi:hypothetical protein
MLSQGASPMYVKSNKAGSIVADFGNMRRVWPSTASARNGVFFTVGVARPFLPLSEQRLLLYGLEPYNNMLKRLMDLTSIDASVNTSGKPFFKDDLGMFIPAWNAYYYVNGRIYFKIFHSKDLIEFRSVYADPAGTYGNHFFTDPSSNTICIGVGRGWKGEEGIISYTPLSSYVLCSEDGGEHWVKIYELKYPSAIYDGIIIDELMLFTAREKSLYL